MTVRVRFAPSPTGYLHVGGARTALFNWLFAKHNNGIFLLRIEDTDQIRSTPASVDTILEGLTWLGLNWDEEVYYQSQRLDLYNKFINILLEQGKAYRCYCTPDELESRRKISIEQGKDPKYDRKCLRIKEKLDKPHAIRFYCEEEKEIIINDLVHGEIRFNSKELDDFVIRRTDGLPTYNYAVVVDDNDMKISHVIRGDDHISNTPKQIMLYRALGFEIPKFAHIPMILGPDKTKLSKRHGATSITVYRDMGFLKEAMVNFLARLGWGYKEQEIFTLSELIECFELEKVSKTPAVFDIQKLEWLNCQYLKELILPEEIVNRLKPLWEKEGVDYKQYNDNKLSEIVKTLRERVKTLEELVKASYFYFSDKIKYDEKDAKKFFKTDQLNIFDQLITEFENLEKWNEENIEKVFRNLSERLNMKLNKIIQPCRLAITGRTYSPGMFEMMNIIGKERFIDKLKQAKLWIKNNSSLS